MTDGGLLDKTLADYNRVYQQWNAPKSDDDLNLSSVYAGISSKLSDDDDVCLVCLEQVAAVDAIWSCQSCYEIYHLQCIQKWSLQAIELAKYREQDEIIWHCPKCRHEYTEKHRPHTYYCYCRATINPRVDPWLLAHSCGERCGRRLAECDHICLLMCHPGPCPPCPKVINSSCYCGQQKPQARRCGKQGWTCMKLCNRLLQCGDHRCIEQCHSGDCSPCTRLVERNCHCGRHRQSVSCEQKQWSCGELCTKLLACGKHRCQLECHDRCPPCLRPGISSCPCGRVQYDQTGGVACCIDEVPTCGQTCGRALDCGLHNCTAQCHRGPCPECRDDCLKRCRCGARERTVPCRLPFVCDTKCRKLKNCRRHACNRKCCIGCEPCDQVCNRPLNCGSHKCSSPCHGGTMCYPCRETAQVRCACGETVISVPCGRRKKAKPPKCTRQCVKPPICHHQSSVPHLCHFGDCPPCRQRCDIQHIDCSHRCIADCHSAVWIDVNAPKKGFKPATPRDVPVPKLELHCQPCPPCSIPVAIACKGGHETCTFPCSQLLPYSCGRRCGRQLDCGNHLCEMQCHSVDDIACEQCNNMCSLQRPLDCTHSCPNRCHPKPCAPCKQMVRSPCHCELNMIYTRCWEWSKLSIDERRSKLSCGNICPKLIACGHQCTLICHWGECLSTGECNKSVKLRCKCGRLSKKAICSTLNGIVELSCDDGCLKLKSSNNNQMDKSTVNNNDIIDGAQNDKMDYMNVGARRNRKNKKDRNTLDTSIDHSRLYRIVGIVVVIPIATLVYLYFYKLW